MPCLTFQPPTTPFREDMNVGRKCLAHYRNRAISFLKSTNIKDKMLTNFYKSSSKQPLENEVDKKKQEKYTELENNKLKDFI